MIQADLGAHTTGDLIEGLQAQHARKPFLDPRDAELALRSELLKLLKSTGDTGLFLPTVADGIAIILVIGVNGVGKTTSIAKLTHYFKDGDNFDCEVDALLQRWWEIPNTDRR
ncbi:MAG: hypothetical protein EBT22_02090 [Chloroflexi bacterium]|nr:hypothetical protein [Chloroflexota bacterium]